MGRKGQWSQTLDLEWWNEKDKTQRHGMDEGERSVTNPHKFRKGKSWRARGGGNGRE